MLKVWRADPVGAVAAELAPGVVALRDGRLVVGCGEGALALDEVQPAGGRRMSGATFLNGHPGVANGRLGS
jgi:methionyl-tRNA formyltransferase